MWENIPRILSPELTAELTGKFINIQPIFGWLTSTGNVEKLELMKTFNCGIGMILIASLEDQLPHLQALIDADRARITTSVISNKDFPTRDDFDAALSAELLKHNVEIVCLAGFMRVLTPGFVKQWKGRLLNIHPSLLPKYKGIKAQQEALESGDTESGCTVHFVDENVDTGAIITQEIVPIVTGDTVESLSARILKSEHIAFPRALRLVASGYVKLNNQLETEWA